MKYTDWRAEIFGLPPGIAPIDLELSKELFLLSETETLDHIDRMLADDQVHELFSREQIEAGLNNIYMRGWTDLVVCYIDESDDSRRIEGIENLRFLYSNYFERYCTSPVTRPGSDLTDGEMGQLCFMFWDIFILSPERSSPGMVNAAIEVMANALHSKNENVIVSAIHGLGEWVFGAPQAKDVLENWLQNPATDKASILKYANQAKTGCIL